MPVYNGENTIQRSLDSLLEQGATPFELVVVNDCSTDNTSEVLEQFSINAPEHISVKIIQHEENGGVAKARNTALSHAIGEYILWLDADDYYAPKPSNSCFLFLKPMLSDTTITCSMRQNQGLLTAPNLKRPKQL